MAAAESRRLAPSVPAGVAVVLLAALAGACDALSINALFSTHTDLVLRTLDPSLSQRSRDVVFECPSRYKVRPGDTCRTIALRETTQTIVTTDSLMLLNPGIDCNNPTATEILCISRTNMIGALSSTFNINDGKPVHCKTNITIQNDQRISLIGISQQYHVSLAYLAKLNNNNSSQLQTYKPLAPGTNICVFDSVLDPISYPDQVYTFDPPKPWNTCTETVVVHANHTCQSIADDYKTTFDNIVHWNTGIKCALPDNLYYIVGRKVCVAVQGIKSSAALTTILPSTSVLTTASILTSSRDDNMTAVVTTTDSTTSSSTKTEAPATTPTDDSQQTTTEAPPSTTEPPPQSTKEPEPKPKPKPQPKPEPNSGNQGCLNEINAARDKYNVAEMQWSQDLADTALSIGESLAANPGCWPSSGDPHGGRQNENLFAGGPPNDGWCSWAIGSWLSEGFDSCSGPNHASAMLWKDATKVGCARGLNPDGSCMTVVCHFGDTVNFNTVPSSAPNFQGTCTCQASQFCQGNCNNC